MNKAIEIEHLTVSYREHPAITDINLTVNKGDFLGIIGPNGGGKSTLMKSILGIIPKNSGTIKIFGESVEKSRDKIGYVPQFSDVDKTFPLSVLEAVMTGTVKSGLHPFFKYSPKNHDKAMEKLKLVGIESLAKRQISMLSGGEFQRMLIARALAAEPEILFLDEPTASVDPQSRKEIFSVLEKLNNNITVILITHDLNAVLKQVKSVICLNERILYSGSAKSSDEIFSTIYENTAYTETAKKEYPKNDGDEKIID